MTNKDRSGPPPSPEHQEAKRLNILEAAATEFALSGFDAASVDNIARRAGIGKGTIYIHFDSKEQLFSDCLQLLCDDLTQLMAKVTGTGIDMPLLQRFLVLSDRLTELADRRHHFVTMYFASLFGVNPRGRALVLQSARDVISAIAQVFAAGQAQNLVRPDAPPDLLAHLIFMNRMVYSRLLDSLELRDHSRARQSEFLLEIHWRGIKADQSADPPPEAAP